MKTRAVLLSIILGGVSVSIPATIPVLAAADNMKAATNSSDFSDRERMKSSADEKKQLEQVLKTGEDRDFYRRDLEKMGWQITAVNYDKPDYLEYEIVKGPSTYEIQVDFDKNSHKATKVNVAWNMWKADATEKALKGDKVEFPKKTTTNANRFSERDRMKSSKSEKTKLEQALKPGEERDFYRRELEKMGWQITSVNYDKPESLEFEIVKGPSTYEVQVDFDKNSHKASKVDVAYNLWEADATKKALKRN
ncbi:MAG: hypothetical protein Q8P23_03690 [bacterium]|nr:hypothetical protein [bacterium]MDZ4340885.1 hypothetical protein [Candidatus Binatia bacterium]